MYAKFIPISAVEPFVLFPFTRDYLNLEMFKIFYLLGVYVKNVYFCMIFTFVFFFERSMQIPIKILHLRPSIESTCIWNLQTIPFPPKNKQNYNC
jgi:hypothetical protein